MPTPAKRNALAGFVTAALLLATTQISAAADRAGCHDPEGMPRFLNSSIALCMQKNFAEYTLPTGAITEYDFDRHKATMDDKLTMEGHLTQLLYTVPRGASTAEVFRNYKNALQSTGFQVLFEASGYDFGPAQGNFFENMGPGGQLVGYSLDESRYAAVTKEDPTGKTYAALYIIEYQDGFNPDLEVPKGQVLVRLDVVKVDTLKDSMVTVSAAQIARALDTSGQVILSGIFFDFNQAFLKPESRPAIVEIANFLRGNPGRNVYIVGHTDNVGGPDFNMQLSQARAGAVVGELVSNFGINPGQLKPRGMGMSQPIASNDTDEGRARNRRVEMVPQ